MTMNGHRETTRRKCLAIRDRIYPEDVWPATMLERSIQSLGSWRGVLLEIGCGRNASLLRRVCGDYRRSIGLDVEIAAQANLDSGCLLLRGDGHRIPIGRHGVDVVVCVDVMEHLADPNMFFRECRRVLKPGGHLLVFTVNKNFPPIVAARWMPHGMRRIVNRIVSGTREEDTFPVFYRANSVGALRACAAAEGLEPVWMRYVSHHPIYFMFSVAVYRAAVCIERIVRRHEGLGFLRHMIHACFRNPEPAVDRRVERAPNERAHTASAATDGGCSMAATENA